MDGSVCDACFRWAGDNADKYWDEVKDMLDGAKPKGIRANKITLSDYLFYKFIAITFMPDETKAYNIVKYGPMPDDG